MNLRRHSLFALTSALCLGLCTAIRAQDAHPEKHAEPRPEKNDPHAAAKPSKEERMGQIARMKREIEELSRAGHHEKAEQLKHRLAQIHGETGEHKKHPPAEGIERLQHLKQAISHLRAAGLDEPAKNLEQALAEMSMEFERDRREFEKHKKAAGKEGGGGSPEIRRELEEVRAQMQRMAREMEELRAQFQKQQQRP